MFIIIPNTICTFFITLIQNLLIFVFGSVIVVVAISHLYVKWRKLSPVKLTADSVVVIIGGCTGIGRQMVIELAKLYHPQIIVIDVKNNLFEGLEKQAMTFNSNCFGVKCDLAQPEQVSKVLEEIKDRYKKIDFMIYNAGVFFPSLSWEANQKDFDTLINVNYFSVVKFITTLLPNLDNGHIAVTASIASIINGGIFHLSIGPLMSSYVASKHALYGYLSCFRQELKKKGTNVTISIGCPYAINTGLFEGFNTKVGFVCSMLDQKYVAGRLIRQFVKKKEVCFVGRKHAFVVKVLSFFPSQLNDFLIICLDSSDFTKKVK